MKKVNNKKGFTLAELLVVIAILAVLVAVAVPVFTSQLNKAKDSVIKANYRAAQSAAMVDYLDSEDPKSGVLYYTYTVDSETKDIELGTPTPTDPGDSGVDNATETGGTVKIGE